MKQMDRIMPKPTAMVIVFELIKNVLGQVTSRVHKNKLFVAQQCTFTLFVDFIRLSIRRWPFDAFVLTDDTSQLEMQALVWVNLTQIPNIDKVE
jgi:hypothetical protein